MYFREYRSRRSTLKDLHQRRHELRAEYEKLRSTETSLYGSLPSYEDIVSIEGKDTAMLKVGREMEERERAKEREVRAAREREALVAACAKGQEHVVHPATGRLQRLRHIRSDLGDRLIIETVHEVSA